mmetsp:Transcript_12498/g.21069  ORF Transcript_12498/g.21069 Transcript_12498/m.21069 type:complete len:203 (-) Transcript_12498:2924-3532(-)
MYELVQLLLLWHPFLDWLWQSFLPTLVRVCSSTLSLFASRRSPLRAECARLQVRRRAPSVVWTGQISIWPPLPTARSTRPLAPRQTFCRARRSLSRAWPLRVRLRARPCRLRACVWPLRGAPTRRRPRRVRCATAQFRRSVSSLDDSARQSRPTTSRADLRALRLRTRACVWRRRQRSSTPLRHRLGLSSLRSRPRTPCAAR